MPAIIIYKPTSHIINHLPNLNGFHQLLRSLQIKKNQIYLHYVISACEHRPDNFKLQLWTNNSSFMHNQMQVYIQAQTHVYIYSPISNFKYPTNNYEKLKTTLFMYSQSQTFVSGWSGATPDRTNPYGVGNLSIISTSAPWCFFNI